MLPRFCECFFHITDQFLLIFPTPHDVVRLLDSINRNISKRRNKSENRRSDSLTPEVICLIRTLYEMSRSHFPLPHFA